MRRIDLDRSYARFRLMHWLREDARSLGHVTVQRRWFWVDQHGRIGQ